MKIARYPSYLALLDSGELERRVAKLVDGLDKCRSCPRNCRAGRSIDKRGYCNTGRYAEVASWCLHHGEEPCISGGRGSGTVFFAHCNLSCLFCQNHQISRQWPPGQSRKKPGELAAIYLDLQAAGAHNLNWVSPGHVVPQAVEALLIAARRGLSIPVVYNSNGYDSVETLTLLDDVVDIYLPDLKYARNNVAKALSGAEGYVPNSRGAIMEMWRQVGPLEVGEDGLARRGLLTRHLVLPGRLSQAKEVLFFLASSLGKTVAVSLMAQYHPSNAAHAHPVLRRGLLQKEYDEALAALDASGITDGYVQALASRDSYLPDFNSAHPFAYAHQAGYK